LLSLRPPEESLGAGHDANWGCGTSSRISASQVIFCTKKQEKSSAENVLMRALICDHRECPRVRAVKSNWVAGFVPALVCEYLVVRIGLE